jgi:ABC-type Mn2+/Zn2+ transport system permease subunit
MATAVGVGSVAVVLGALISYHHDTAAGATMALVAVLFCFAVMGVRGLREAPQPAR